jgi:glutamate-1-semialdehyde 2,1-aminomutase
MIAGLKFDLRGAHHAYGVQPDLATFGKAIANGFCFSALIGKRSIMELGGLQHPSRRVFLLSQTHSSETTGLAACRATLDECQRVDISKHVWKVGKQLVEGTRAMARSEGVADFVRMIGFDCNPQLLCTRKSGAYWPELHTSFHEEVISHGVLIPWTTITYSHGSAELELTMAALQAGMRKVRTILDSGIAIEKTFTGTAVKPVFRRFNRCMQNRCGRIDPDAQKLLCCEEASA